MINLNINNEIQELKRLHNITIEKNSVKNDCYVTRYIYESKNKAQDGPIETSDDPHSVQRRRYFNTRRGV
jgi:hypothetical protein